MRRRPFDSADLIIGVIFLALAISFIAGAIGEAQQRECRGTVEYRDDSWRCTEAK